MLDPPEGEVNNHNDDQVQRDEDDVSDMEIADQTAESDEQGAAARTRGKRTRAAAAKQEPPLKKQRVDATPKKLGKWTHDEDLTLLAAIKAYVKANKGQLPSIVRTTATTTCPRSWKQIASKVTKVATMTPDAGGKACSNRWSIMRANSKVRQTDNVTNRVCLPYGNTHLSMFSPGACRSDHPAPPRAAFHYVQSRGRIEADPRCDWRGAQDSSRLDGQEEARGDQEPLLDSDEHYLRGRAMVARVCAN